MKCIVNVTSNWGIGNGNRLLVNIPDDMKWFRTHTKDKIVILGRKTLDSFPGGKPLKNRVNIVISKSRKGEVDGLEGETRLIYVDSVDAALDMAHEIINDYWPEYTDDDVYVIGGESIYKAMLPFVNTAIVTRTSVMLPADTYFPDLDTNEDWELTETSDEMEHEGIRFKFCTYKRK